MSVVCALLGWAAFWSTLGLVGLEPRTIGETAGTLMLTAVGLGSGACVCGVMAMFNDRDNAILGAIGAIVASPVLIFAAAIVVRVAVAQG